MLEHFSYLLSNIDGEEIIMLNNIIEYGEELLKDNLFESH